VLIPRYRRWGAWLIALMLIAFMATSDALSSAGRPGLQLLPWLKRAVTPRSSPKTEPCCSALLAAWFSASP